MIIIGANIVKYTTTAFQTSDVSFLGKTYMHSAGRTNSVVCHHHPFLGCCKGNHSLRNWQVICDFFSSCSDFGIFRHRDLVLNTLMRALGVPCMRNNV